MSTHLYVHQENQKLLWTTIQNVPFIANLPPDFKQDWFRNIIKMFYEQNPEIRDKSSLQNINKPPLQYMVNSAKHILEQQSQSVRKDKPAISPSAIQSEFTRYDSDSKKNHEWYSKAFAERQKEYEIMHAKPLAPDIDFSIKLDDSPITNVNELVEKYKREREQDMNVYSNLSNSIIPNPQMKSNNNQVQVSVQAPVQSPTPVQVPVPTPVPTPISSSLSKQKTSRLQVIKEEDAVLDIDETLSSPVIANSSSEIEDLKKQINDLKLEIEDMKKTLNSIVANASR